MDRERWLLGRGRVGPSEVEGLTRVKAHRQHSLGASPELGDDHTLSSPPSRAAAVPALLPLALSCQPTGAQISGVCSFLVWCLGEVQDLSF